MKVREIIEKSNVQWIPATQGSETPPIVSVLLPTYRRAQNGLFETAVLSVLNQDFRNLELLIIDDASTDGTAGLIDYYMKIDSRVSCIRHGKNIGLPAISEYEAYQKARGDYIAFIFDDNKWERDYISKTISFMARNNAKAVYGKVRSYYGAGPNDYIELGNSKSNLGTGMHTLLATNHIANGGVVLAREVVEKVGLYDPHITMTRLCDWDLWKRIVTQYEFFESGIQASEELGASQKDSLGNSYAMDAWAVAERESVRNICSLCPPCFGEIEINEVTSDNTVAFSEAVSSLYKTFQKKAWYVPIELNCESDTRHSRLRIMVLASCYDATTALSFDRMKNADNADIFRFGTPGTALHEISQADAVILIRNAYVFDRHKRACDKLGIPCFLYLDDNFIELRRANKRDPELQALCVALEQGRSSSFNGLLVSTPALKEYCEKEGLNAHVTCIEPCIQAARIQPMQERDPLAPITFAYMGGPFRDRMLQTHIMPALASLASRTKAVRLLYPSRINLESWDKVRGLELVGIEYSLSLDAALARYEKYHPQFLLHVGSDIENNKYKTENALINATQMGAVLIASNFMPYKGICEQGLCVCAENKADVWKQVLQVLIEDDERRKEIYQAALRYCLTRYIASKASAALKTALSGIASTSDYEMICRMREIMHEMLYGGPMMTEGFVPDGSQKPERSLTDTILSFSGGIPTERKYRIVCTEDRFSELGICFASLGEPHGCIHIIISNQEGPLRECVLDMDDFTHDNWSYVTFDPIVSSKGRTYVITLRFEYAEGSAMMGVFEDQTKRSIFYRVMNKIGKPLLVNDLLFVDCR